MAILVLFADFCMMAVLSCACFPIHELYDNAPGLIFGGKSRTHITDTLNYKLLLLLIREWLGWLALEM
jgi:hypothetical protein